MKAMHMAIPHGFRGIAGLGLLLVLAGCNGGDDASNGISLPTAPVTITTANAPVVAGAAIGIAVGALSLPVGAQTSASAAPLPASIALRIGRLGSSVVQQILFQRAASASTSGIVITDNCLVSGTVSIDQPDGSSATVTYNNCSDVAGETISGTLSISNITTTATTISADLVHNITIATASPANTATATGDMHVVIDAATLILTSISGTKLTTSNTNAELGATGISNYTFGFDSAGNVTAMTFTFASTVIGGTAVFTLTSPFFGSNNVGSLFPSSGGAIITGANSTQLRMTVLGDESAPVNSQVRLELSTDGGASYGTPMLYTWAQISALQ